MVPGMWQEVVEGMATRFASQAGQLLENLRQTESALKRLKKNRPEAGEAGQLSDIEKISLQLFLDVQVGLFGHAGLTSPPSNCHESIVKVHCMCVCMPQQCKARTCL